MDMTTLIVAMGVAAIALILLLWLLLRGRPRPKVIAAAPAGAVSGMAPQEETPIASMTMAAADSVVRAMAARGETIQAVKMVREMTGLGLKEAKDYVDALPNAPPMMTVARQMVAAAVGQGSSTSMRTDAAALVARGQALDAIKLVRERTGMGLKEAKDYVDELAEAQRRANADPRRPLDDPGLRETVARLLAGGQSNEAMHLIQRASGCSIEAARTYIDQVRRG
jgi:ribosomal protein L7/L12